MKQMAEHIASFISDLWQIHAFGEGNTRTTAVFTFKYLRTFGFDITNDIFAVNAFYFRNALVRANYNNFKKGIHASREYLDLFFANLLSGEENKNPLPKQKRNGGNTL
jgi:fido (protein-threonine AMPylation protein)